jgi:hypothetical protein
VSSLALDIVWLRALLLLLVGLVLVYLKFEISQSCRVILTVGTFNKRLLKQA